MPTTTTQHETDDILDTIAKSRTAVDAGDFPGASRLLRDALAAAYAVDDRRPNRLRDGVRVTPRAFVESLNAGLNVQRGRLEEFLGVMELGERSPPESFDEDDVAILRRLADALEHHVRGVAAPIDALPQ